MGAARTTLPKNTIAVRAKPINRRGTMNRDRERKASTANDEPPYKKTCVMAAVVKNAIVA